MRKNVLHIFQSIFCAAILVSLANAILGQTAPTRTARVNEFTASEQRPGSALVYNLYTSGITGTSKNTQINLTNTHTTQSSWINLFFISNDCLVVGSSICLTPNQTATFLASDVDPGITGYLIAVTVHQETGCPVGFNFLAGSEQIKLATGHNANLPAEAFQALFTGVIPGCPPNSSKAVMNFDGRMYSPAPRTLALNYIPSRADGNDTVLIVNNLSGSLDTVFRGAASQYFGLLYDDAENVVSFTLNGNTCQLMSSLGNAFPRTTPRFETFIPAGRSGWLQIFTTRGAALTGAVINFNATSATAAKAFDGGYNLHHLDYTVGQLTILVIPPSC